jgi:hypothetical protein
MGPLVRLLNCQNCQSKVILGDLERRRCIARQGGGLTTPRGPAAPIHPCAERKRRKKPTCNRLRSSDQGRPKRETVDHRVGHTS